MGIVIIFVLNMIVAAFSGWTGVEFIVVTILEIILVEVINIRKALTN